MKRSLVLAALLALAGCASQPATNQYLWDEYRHDELAARDAATRAINACNNPPPDQVAAVTEVICHAAQLNAELMRNRAETSYRLAQQGYHSADYPAAIEQTAYLCRSSTVLGRTTTYCN